MDIIQRLKHCKDQETEILRSDRVLRDILWSVKKIRGLDGKSPDSDHLIASECARLSDLVQRAGLNIQASPHFIEDVLSALNVEWRDV